MKKLLSVLFIFSAIATHAQTAPGWTSINTRYQWLGGTFGELKVPAYGDTSSAPVSWKKAGNIILDTTGSDKGIYLRYDNKWNKISSSTGSGSGNVYAGYGLVNINDSTLAANLDTFYTKRGVDSLLFGVKQVVPSLASLASAIDIKLSADTLVKNAGGTAAVEGDRVATWGDQSASAKDATQSTNGSRPIFHSRSTYNGKPYLEFSNSVMTNSSWVGFGSNKVAAMTFIAAKIITTTSGNFIDGPSTGNNYGGVGIRLDGKTIDLSSSNGSALASYGDNYSDGLLITAGLDGTGAGNSTRTIFYRNNSLEVADSYTGTFPANGGTVAAGYTIGANASQTSFINVEYYEIIHTNRLLTPSEITLVQEYLRIKWFSTAQTKSRMPVEGPSTIEGYPNQLLTRSIYSIPGMLASRVGGNYYSPTSVLLPNDSSNLWTVWNDGTRNQSMPDFTAQIPTNQKRRDGWAKNNILPFWPGANDLLYVNDVTLRDSVKTYCDTMRASGFKVIIGTLPPRNDVGNTSPITYESRRTAYNTWVRANWATFADNIADIASDSRMSNTADTRYFDADQVHLTDAGNAVAADYFFNAIKQIAVLKQGVFGINPYSPIGTDAGLQLVDNRLSLTTADSLHPGGVDTTTQVFQGRKQFIKPFTIGQLFNPQTNDLIMGNAALGHTANLLRLGVNGTDRFDVNKDGNLTVLGGNTLNSGGITSVSGMPYFQGGFLTTFIANAGNSNMKVYYNQSGIGIYIDNNSAANQLQGLRIKGGTNQGRFLENRNSSDVALSGFYGGGGVFFKDSLTYNNAPSIIPDTTNLKPLVIDGSGNVKKSFWAYAGSGGGGGSISTSDDNLTISGSTISTNTVPQNLTDGATITFTTASGINGKVTLGGNRTLSIPSPQSGKTYLVEVTQDGTGGRTLTLPGGGSATLNTTAAAVTLLTGYYNGSTWTWGSNYSTGGGGGITSINSMTGSAQTIATGTTAQSNDIGVVSSSNTTTIHIPDASATVRGVITTGSQTFAGVKTFNSQPTFGGGILVQGAISQVSATPTSGNIYVPNTTTAVAQTATNYILSSSANLATRAALGGNTTFTVGVGHNYGGILFPRQPVTEAASSNHPLIASTVFLPLVVTGGSATVGNTATIYSEGATNATTTNGNYNLWMDYGMNRLDSNTAIGFLASTAQPTAKLHLGAGSASAGSASLKIEAGTLMTTPEAGAVEATTDKMYYTIGTGTARKEVTLNDAALTSGTVPVATTNGRLTDGLIIAESESTPTLTSVSNVSSSSTSSNSLSYTRVGNKVTFTLIITVTPTLTATDTQIDFSLPIASNFANSTNLTASGAAIGATYTPVFVNGDVSNDRGHITFTATSTGAHTVTITGNYKII